MQKKRYARQTQINNKKRDAKKCKNKKHTATIRNARQNKENKKREAKSKNKKLKATKKENSEREAKRNQKYETQRKSPRTDLLRCVSQLAYFTVRKPHTAHPGVTAIPC